MIVILLLLILLLVPFCFEFDPLIYKIFIEVGPIIVPIILFVLGYFIVNNNLNKREKIKLEYNNIKIRDTFTRVNFDFIRYTEVLSECINTLKNNPSSTKAETFTEFLEKINISLELIDNVIEQIMSDGYIGNREKDLLDTIKPKTQELLCTMPLVLDAFNKDFEKYTSEELLNLCQMIIDDTINLQRDISTFTTDILIKNLINFR